MPNTAFATHLDHDRRLVILRLLAEMPTIRVNSSVLAVALDRFGYASTHAQTKIDLGWLQEHALVRLEDLGPVLVAIATESGLEVASGRAMVKGVARPGA